MPRLRLRILVGVCTLLVAAGAAAWLARSTTPSRVLRIGINHDPPQMFLGANGRPQGLVVDVIASAARRAGLAVEWHRIQGQSADRALRDGTVDLWPSLTMLPE